MGESASWNPDDDLDALSARTDHEYYSRDQSSLCELPSELQERCWQALEARPGHHSAANILFNAFRVRDDRASMLRLKQLLETTLPVESRLVDKITREIEARTDPDVRRALHAQDLTKEMLDAAPLSLVDPCFFSDAEDKSSHLVGSLRLTLYRVRALRTEPTGYLALTCAICEAFGYYRAGEAAAAGECLRWAETVLKSLESQLDVDHKARLGVCYCATALAVDEQQPSERETRLRRALTLLPTADDPSPANGDLRDKADDARAECLWSLGQLYQQRNELADALRWYQAARAVKTTDRMLPELIRGSWSALKAELEGNAEHFAVPSHVDQGIDYPIEHFEHVKGLLTDMMTGGEVSQDSLLHAVQLHYQRGAYLQGERAPKAVVFENYVQLLVMLLTLDDLSEAPCELEDVIDVARAHCEFGEPHTQIEFQLACEYHRLRSARVVLGRGRLLRSLLEEISQLRKPIQRVATLQKFLTLLCAQQQLSSEPQSQVSLAMLCEVSASAFEEQQQLTPTAESGSLPRYVADDVLRCLTFLIFFRLGRWQGDNTTLQYCRANLHLEELDEEDQRLLEAYRKLLWSASDWMRHRYHERGLHASLANLPEDEQREFHRLCDETAEIFRAATKARYRPKKDERLVSAVGRLRELRSQAQCQPDATRALSKSAPTITAGMGHVFIVDVLPRPNHLAGVVVFEAGYVHLWCSRRWTELVDQYDGLLADGKLRKDTPRFYESLDTVAREFHQVEEFEFSSMIGLFGPLRVSKVAVLNLTRCEVAFSCLSDSQCRFPTFAGNPERGTEADDRPRFVYFWSPVRFGRNSTVQIDESGRCVLNAGKVAMQYPDLLDRTPSVGEMPPLWYAPYEKWSLEDTIAKHGDIALESSTCEEATRENLLERSWNASTAIHLTTHGCAFSDFPESPQLFSGGSADDPQRIHFLDILARDWSSISLVFLNACLTQAGEKKLGEDTLSLAWAFLAGGAGAVIANRWAVPDDAAWFFAKTFYESWLIGDDARSFDKAVYERLGDDDGPSIQRAFHEALRKTREHPRFSNPHQWGAFVLLR